MKECAFLGLHEGVYESVVYSPAMAFFKSYASCAS